MQDNSLGTVPVPVAVTPGGETPALADRAMQELSAPNSGTGMSAAEIVVGADKSSVEVPGVQTPKPDYGSHNPDGDSVSTPGASASASNSATGDGVEVEGTSGNTSSNTSINNEKSSEQKDGDNTDKPKGDDASKTAPGQGGDANIDTGNGNDGPESTSAETQPVDLSSATADAGDTSLGKSANTTDDNGGEGKGD